MLSRLKTLSEQNLKSKCYLSIDTLSIFNWWQIHQTNDFTLLQIDRSEAIDKKALGVLWANLYDQYFAKFGLGDNFITILEKKKEIALMKCERWVEGDKSLETLIQVAEIELSELEAANGGDFLQTKGYIEKTLAFQINLKETSVSEYYSYLKTAINGK